MTCWVSTLNHFKFPSNSIANHHCLPGNDPDLDPDREPEPPVQAVDKPIPRTGKRTTGGDRPRDGPRSAPRGGSTDTAGNDQSTFPSIQKKKLSLSQNIVH